MTDRIQNLLSMNDVCSCGKRGCAEQYCSATGVVRVAKRFLAASEMESTLRNLENMTCKDVFDAGKAGDEAARQILEQVGYSSEELNEMLAAGAVAETT